MKTETVFLEFEKLSAQIYSLQVHVSFAQLKQPQHLSQSSKSVLDDSMLRFLDSYV